MPGQLKFLETFLCRPPNVLLFQLNRVNYDIEKQKLVKDNRRFDFEQTIFCDYFLNENKERSKAHRKELNLLKNSLNKLREALSNYQKEIDIVKSFEMTEKLVSDAMKPENATTNPHFVKSTHGEDFDYLMPN